MVFSGFDGCLMYVDGVVRKVDARVIGKLLELLSANGGRSEINKLLLADDNGQCTSG